MRAVSIYCTAPRLVPTRWTPRVDRSAGRLDNQARARVGSGGGGTDENHRAGVEGAAFPVRAAACGCSPHGAGEGTAVEVERVGDRAIVEGLAGALAHCLLVAASVAAAGHGVPRGVLPAARTAVPGQVGALVLVFAAALPVPVPVHVLTQHSFLTVQVGPSTARSVLDGVSAQGKTQHGVLVVEYVRRNYLGVHRLKHTLDRPKI